MGMQPIVFKVALFAGDHDQARSQYSLLWMLEALCRVNQSHIRQMRHMKKAGDVPSAYPLLYRSGVHYEREKGTEEWLDIPHVLASASGPPEFPPGPWGDCEDLACWRVAEVRELREHCVGFGVDGKPLVADPRFVDWYKTIGRDFWKKKGGIKAKPYAKWRLRPDGSYAYHALVMMPDGRLEDPSLTLGMTWEAEFQAQGLAEKYRRGEVPIRIRYADLPDVTVVDPEKPSGYGGSSKKDIVRAKIATGLARASATLNGVSEYASWGYDHAEVREEDMSLLRALFEEDRS